MHGDSVMERGYIITHHGCIPTLEILACDMHRVQTARTSRVQSYAWTSEIEKPTDAICEHSSSSTRRTVLWNLVYIVGEQQFVIVAHRAGIDTRH